MAEPAPVVSLQNVSRRYGRRRMALDGVTLDLREGELLALVGENGAGKSTLVRLVCGLEKPSLGRVVRRHLPSAIGYCPQADAFYPELTARENLAYAGALHGLRRSLVHARTETLLRELNLADHGDERAERLSGGMQRRLTLAIAFVHEPQVVVVEEPEAGLDPASRITMQTFLARRAKGRSILLVSHDFEGVDRLAHRIVILSHGRLVAEGTPKELEARARAISREGTLPPLQLRARPLELLLWHVGGMAQ